MMNFELTVGTHKNNGIFNNRVVFERGIPPMPAEISQRNHLSLQKLAAYDHINGSRLHFSRHIAIKCNHVVEYDQEFPQQTLLGSDRYGLCFYGGQPDPRNLQLSEKSQRQSLQQDISIR
jgi:hypothetical protein